ncbi:hypothetical protein H8E88_18410 [candidate division KSB1 bacterium]|nr:hypothetical protein [candidate division KSB1 bacterium]MBL7092965.1 hypothetical protein [candidate division KSB1 bacterium]
MISQTLKLEALEKKKLKEILQAVVINQTVLTVQFPGGEEVIIQPKPPLKPLPILNGYVPKGWKEEIY